MDAHFECRLIGYEAGWLVVGWASLVEGGVESGWMLVLVVVISILVVELVEVLVEVGSRWLASYGGEGWWMVVYRIPRAQGSQPHAP